MGGREGHEAAAGRHRKPAGPGGVPGGSPLIAVDTNILVYAHRSGFAQHESALRRLRGLIEGSEPFAIPVFVASEFIRVVTHPRLLRPPSSREHAVSSLGYLLSTPNARILNPGERFWPLLGAAVLEAKASGDLVFDAQIVAVCREHAVDEILTEDRDYNRFPGMTVRSLQE